MASLSDLYQEIVMDHRRSPRNQGLPDGHDHSAEGYNPFCGDRVSVALVLDGDRIADIGFEGEGCAISIASASLMTDSVKGRSVEETAAIFADFRELLTGTNGTPAFPDDLADLEALAGVKAYPTRIKCAILSWHTLKAALENETQPVSTE